MIFFSVTLQHFSCRSTTVETLHATFLQSFGYGDVVHQFEKRCTLLRQGKLEEAIASTQKATDFQQLGRKSLQKL